MLILNIKSINYKKASQSLREASHTCSRLEGVTQAMESGLFEPEKVGAKFEGINLKNIKRILGSVYLELELYNIKSEYDSLFNVPEEDVK